MDLPEEFPPSIVLAAVADHLKDHHSDLQVTLPSNHFLYQEALSATMESVRGLPDRILLPTNNPIRREALRKMALENKEEATPFSSSRPIITTGKVEPEDCPKSLSPDTEKYPAGMLLARVADHIHKHHSDLRVALSTNHIAYQEALATTMDCVRGLPDRCLLPTTNPIRRAALRKMALEDKDFSSNRRIRTPGKLGPEDWPKPLSPNMNLSKKYPVSMILARVADHIQNHHSDLHVALSTNHVTYQEVLAASMDCVRGLPDYILLPTINPARQEALRNLALDNKSLCDEKASLNRETGVDSCSRRIREL